MTWRQRRWGTTTSGTEGDDAGCPWTVTDAEECDTGVRPGEPTTRPDDEDRPAAEGRTTEEL
jgi:hypothetical protein